MSAAVVRAVLDATAAPLTLDVLVQRTGLSRRDVERAVNELRHAGVAILTDREGARLCRTREEGLEAYRRLRARALVQLRTAAAARRAAYRLPDPDAGLWGDL